MDVDPVGAGGVVDDGPALEGGGGFGVFGVGEEDPVGGFPDGDLGDVADAEVALACAAVWRTIQQSKVAEALAAVVGEQLEVAVDVGFERVVEQADGDGGGELEGAGGAGVGDDGEEAAVGLGFVGVGLGFGDLGAQVDGQDAAGEREARARDGDARAADGVVEIDVRGVARKVERQGFELLVERRGGVVAGARDAAAVEVDGGEGLEDVVELGGGEVDGDGLVAGDAARVLEEADAVFVEGDVGDGELLDGDVGRGGFLGGGVGRAWAEAARGRASRTA